MMNTEDNNGNEPLGLWNVVSIGIGVMVGAGIFVLLEQAALLVEASTWVAFAFGGIVAMFSGYAYVRLGAGYPSNNGIVDLFRRELGNDVFPLALSLLYLLTLAMSIVMVVRVFGTYTVQFLYEDSQEEHPILLYMSGIVAVMTLFNSLSNRMVGWLEVILVDIKIMILLLLTIAGVWLLQPAHISVSAPPSFNTFLSCIGITFLAYAGSGMMANAVDEVKNPQVIISRTFLAVTGVTTLLYILLVLVLLGDVSALELRGYADAVVTQVASPPFGRVGYVIVVISALLAMASAISANLLIVPNTMDGMGGERELPKLMDKSLWRQSTWGNITVVVLIMLMVAALNLDSLANVASATFLICYLAMFAVTIRLYHDIHASLPIPIAGTLMMLLVIVGFIYSLWFQGSRALIWIIGSLLLGLTMAIVMKRGKIV